MNDSNTEPPSTLEQSSDLASQLVQPAQPNQTNTQTSSTNPNQLLRPPFRASSESQYSDTDKSIYFDAPMAHFHSSTPGATMGHTPNLGTPTPGIGTPTLNGIETGAASGVKGMNGINRENGTNGVSLGGARLTPSPNNLNNRFVENLQQPTQPPVTAAANANYYTQPNYPAQYSGPAHPSPNPAAALPSQAQGHPNTNYDDDDDDDVEEGYYPNANDITAHPNGSEGWLPATDVPPPNHSHPQSHPYFPNQGRRDVHRTNSTRSTGGRSTRSNSGRAVLRKRRSGGVGADGNGNGPSPTNPTEPTGGVNRNRSVRSTTSAAPSAVSGRSGRSSALGGASVRTTNTRASTRSRKSLFTNADGLPVDGSTFIDGAGTTGPRARAYSPGANAALGNGAGRTGIGRGGSVRAYRSELSGDESAYDDDEEYDDDGEYDHEGGAGIDAVGADLARRREQAEQRLSGKELGKVGKSEAKQSKRLSKIIKKEHKVEKASLEVAMKELGELQGVQKAAVKREAKAHTLHTKSLTALQKAEQAYLAAKTKYDIALAGEQSLAASLEMAREYAYGCTKNVQDKAAEVDGLRQVWGVDERERAVFVSEAKKKPAKPVREANLKESNVKGGKEGRAAIAAKGREETRLREGSVKDQHQKSTSGPGVGAGALGDSQSNVSTAPATADAATAPAEGSEKANAVNAKPEVAGGKKRSSGFWRR